MGANVREEVERARADEMEAQRGARPNLSRSFLKKTRGSQPRNRIRHRLPPEYPAGHRKAQSRVTQMHEPHRYPQPSQICSSPQGRDQHHYRQNSSGIEGAQGTTVPLKWHGSNGDIAQKWVTQAAPAANSQGVRPPGLKPALILEPSRGAEAPLFHHPSRGGSSAALPPSSSARPCFPLLRFGWRVEPRRWRDCFRRSVS